MLILAAGLDSHPVAADNPALSSPVSIVSAPRSPLVSLTRHSNGELFFDIEDSAPPSADRAARPRRVRIYWDQSVSRADDDLEAEKDLLLRYLDSVHPGIIDLVLLSGGGPELTIIEAPDEAAQLAHALGTLRYDGAWSIHELDLPSLPPADACLYFSDGTVSVDPSEAQRIRCPLLAISSAEDANRGLLRVLARRSAGAYFDLSTTGADNAIAGLTGALPRVTGVASSDGREIEYALLRSGADRIRIIGPAPKSGEIVVTLASGAKRIRTYSFKRLQPRQDDAIGTFWVVDRLHELCAAPEPDSERITTLARRFSLDAAPPTN
jgi:hypothetical protein